MNDPPLILIIEDNTASMNILRARLTAHGYDVVTAANGECGLATAKEKQPDLILLDIMMPKMDGLEVCRRIKADTSLSFIPIILVTAKSDPKDTVAGLEAGGDEYLTKPVDQSALIARVRSMLRIKALHDAVRDQAIRLQEQAVQLSEWNRTLEKRVGRQLSELERIGRLKRFLSPQLAELIVSSENERLLESHRAEITVVFCDLRGFTAFSETGEPEEIMGVLQDYHAIMGKLIFRFKGTLERFSGDGLMVFFNDPLPCDEPAVSAIGMAIAMREEMQDLCEVWKKRGYQLGFGIGIEQGFATLGKIGFEGRFDYAAIGTVTNVASRLCDAALDGQILISQRVYFQVEQRIKIEPLEDLTLSGLNRPVAVYNVLGMAPERPSV